MVSFPILKNRKKEIIMTHEHDVETTLELGKKQRHQLRLPQPYYVVVDDWLDKLGEKSYLLWFKLIAKVDRTDDTRDTVKYTQSKLAKSLDISKPTLIKYLKPLYEYGFINYKEYEFENGNVGMNITVFEAPMNDEANLSKPLVKIRDWDKRTEDKFDFTKKGGRPTHKKSGVKQPVLVTDENLPENMATESGPSVEPAQTVDFADNVAPVVVTEFEHFKEGLTANKVDTDIVVNWVNKNVETVGANEMCFVIKQLATYPEPIAKTAVFIDNTVKMASPLHSPVTQVSETSATIESDEQRNIVPLYNWLEERE